MKIRIFMLVTGALVVAGSANPETILISTGRWCTIIDVARDDNGNVIGNTITNGPCAIPNGTYTFALAVNNDKNVKTVTAGGGGSSQPLLSRFLNQSAETLRSYWSRDQRPDPQLTAKGPYGSLIAFALRSKNATAIRVTIPEGFLAPSAQNRLLQQKPIQPFLIPDLSCMPPNIWNGFACVDAANPSITTAK